LSTNDREYYFNRIENLASGYATLRNKKIKTISDLFKLINAPLPDYDKLKQSIPHESLRDNSILSPVVAAKWLRNILIKYPGILYEDIYAATLLGITQDAFLEKEVQTFFASAKYNGIFSPPEGRWWRSKLIELAAARMKNEELSLPLTSGFPQMWKRIKKMDLSISKCNSSDKTPADCVCCLLKEQTTIPFSLLYPLDSRPDVMDQSRISFKAIKQSNDYNLDFFDTSQKEIINTIRGKKR
jgi:hypothetical protein